MVLYICEHFGSPVGRLQRSAEGRLYIGETILSRPLHIAAAANQLSRKLFDKTDLEGCVMVDDEGLSVLVHGMWPGNKPGNFAGFAVNWRELPIAA